MIVFGSCFYPEFQCFEMKSCWIFLYVDMSNNILYEQIINILYSIQQNLSIISNDSNVKKDIRYIK